jgi:hypothetical protein
MRFWDIHDNEKKGGGAEIITPLRFPDSLSATKFSGQMGVLSLPVTASLCSVVVP